MCSWVRVHVGHCPTSRRVFIQVFVIQCVICFHHHYIPFTVLCHIAYIRESLYSLDSIITALEITTFVKIIATWARKVFIRSHLKKPQWGWPKLLQGICIIKHFDGEAEVNLDDVSISPIAGDRLFVGKYVCYTYCLSIFLLKVICSLVSALKTSDSNSERSLLCAWNYCALICRVLKENWMQVSICDSERKELLPHFDRVCNFIGQAMTDDKSRVNILRNGCIKKHSSFFVHIVCIPYSYVTSHWPNTIQVLRTFKLQVL